jgi:hypothetical protein
MLKKLINFPGGQVAVPRNRNENDLLAHLALKYTDNCDSDDKNGKILWLGIRSNHTVDNWKVW